MRIIESSNKQEIEKIKARNVDLSDMIEKVRPIVLDVKARGDLAIKEWVKKIDKKELSSLLVSIDKVMNAKNEVTPLLLKSLSTSKKNIIKYHINQMPKKWWTEIVPGIDAGQLVRPFERVGCYIPGGRYPLVSTVLMTTIPAKIAGVKEIIVCTPKACPEILAACDLCGVHKVFEVGGPMAIGAMAYGTESIPKVNKIVGPGNLYVTSAKKLVYGDVGIDMLAGPSEIVIIADENANATFIAADMIAQAEHDVTALCILITPSKKLANKVMSCIENSLDGLPTKETVMTALETLGAIIIVESIQEAFEMSNMIAPEHLSIQSDDRSLLDLVVNAGSIFLGEYAAVAAGDYGSGTNHVLPTGGTASSQSGLSVRDFLKTLSVQSVTQKGLKTIGDGLITLAKAEGLMGHAESIKVRINSC